jgi:hypothetical protein
MDLRFTQKLCKIGKSTGFDRHQDDTDAIINDNIVSDESQRRIFIYVPKIYNRKESKLRSWKRLLLAAIILAALMPSWHVFGESVTQEPPSPEPPPPVSTLRPTPVPTAAPDIKVIDRINHPKEYDSFSFPRNAKLLEIWLPNIKDADAAVLRYGGQVYMIDCGDENAAARTVLLLKQLGITQIDILFNSHPHHDHISGLAMTDEAAKVIKLMICFPADSTESGKLMVDTAGVRNIPITLFRDGDVFTMGDGEVTLEFLQCTDAGLDMNSQSSVTMVRYGDCSMLFMADQERPGQEALYNKTDPAGLKCDILKYPHHGKRGMYEPLYAAIDARLVIVTAVEGRRGEFGQMFLTNKKVPTAYTSVRGQFIRLLTDGKYWLCDRVPITVE